MSNIDSFIGDAGLLAAWWTSYCSNKTRSVDECIIKTKEIIDKAPRADGTFDTFVANISTAITDVYNNRGKDKEFLIKLFEIDSQELAVRCLSAIFSILSFNDGIVDSSIENLIKNYAERYGENNGIYLVIKAKWYSMYQNYPGNEEKVEETLKQIERLLQ